MRDIVFFCFTKLRKKYQKARDNRKIIHFNRRQSMEKTKHTEAHIEVELNGHKLNLSKGVFACRCQYTKKKG